MSLKSVFPRCESKIWSLGGGGHPAVSFGEMPRGGGMGEGFCGSQGCDPTPMSSATVLVWKGWAGWGLAWHNHSVITLVN